MRDNVTSQFIHK